MKQVSLTSLARKIANTVGRQMGVQITFSGTQAYTDRRRINLPAIVAGARMSTHEYDLFLGYLDHEVMHVRCTDFDIFKDFDSNYQRTGQFDNLLKHLTNVIEDVRGELEYIEIYPGAKSGLDLVCDHVDKEYLAMLRDKGEGLKAIDLNKAVQLIYEELYTNRGRPHIRSERLTSFKELKDIDLELKKFPDLRNTRDALRMAERLKAILEREFGKQTAPQQQELEELMGIFFAIKHGGALTLVQDKNREIVDLGLQDLPKPKQGNTILPPSNPSLDQIYVYPTENLPRYEAIKEAMGSDLAMMKKHLRIYLQSRKQNSRQRGLEEGKLDTENLWKLQAGDAGIFYQETLRSMMNTAALFMIDLSSSMNSGEVRNAAVLLTEALLGVDKLKVAIAGFTTNSSGGGNPFQRNTAKGVGRLAPLWIPIFKDFDESGWKPRARIGGLECPGLTPIGDGYMYAYEKLATRKEARRVLIILSDGQSSYSIGDADHSDDLQKAAAHARCKRDRIETIGLELGGEARNALKPFTDTARYLTSSSDMATVVLDLVKTLGATNE